MAEHTAEQIAAAQLNYDVAEAKQNLDRALHGTGAGSSVVNAIETLIGKTVMRWWFARICKNKAALSQVDPKKLEERRRVRATTLIAACGIINSKANGGQAPHNLDLQMGLMDLIANNNAIWQALFDAGIIAPDAKQDYLDAGVTELYNRVSGYSGQIDLGKTDPVHLAARQRPQG